MSDLISRQEALDLRFSNGVDNDRVLYVPYHEVISQLKNLPPAQEWIPVSERLPEKDDIYLICVKDGWFPKNVLPIDFLRFEGGKWTYFEIETDSFEDFENPVVAWMPLPEPFKGGDA